MQNELLKILNQDLEKWCSRHGLEVFEAPCQECGSLLKVDIPCALGKLRGIIADKCKCGNEMVPFEVANLYNP